MHTTLFLLTGLLGSLIPATHADTPVYCDPGSPYNANAYWYDDESSICSAFGRGYNYCCATFTGSGTCRADLLDQQTENDLRNVIHQQLPKGSQFDSSSVGGWFAAYTLFQDAAQNDTLESNWSESINKFKAGPPQTLVPGGVSQVFLSVQGDDGLTQIIIERQC
ncbi:hypothetical protein PRZ48_013417 [Zasmidium cellare]|uniref:Uncharacterized protein n=1 Tax=Zasmidium cellare TaxID=395010 RepID=A0ABR0E0Z8_ZASCE|nr:hypothetical protein PRZ48_013417 [Zasmidium cellare]